MYDLKLLSLADLLDLMIEQTAHHTRLISLGATAQEFGVSRDILRELQSEIHLRKANERPQDIPLQDQSSLEATG
jgi:hypothetical protein